MASLITLDEAKADLRVLSDDHDADITLKMNAASELVMKHANQADPDWTDVTAPYLVKAAVLLTLRDLFNSEASIGLTDGAKNLLIGWRDPALA